MSRIDEQIEAARWWKEFRRTNNRHFLPLLFDEHRYLVLCGGGGSGKSIFAGRKILERVTTEPGHRWLVCRKVGRTLRDSCFAQLRGQISEYYSDAGAKFNQSDMRIKFRNDSEIIFAGLDDVEKLKSIFDITGIWVEEASEISEADFNQLDIRLRTRFPYYLQMILSFNPISITHWLKKRFFDTQDERATTDRSTYKDNRFLLDTARITLEKFAETDPYYYQVYCLGQWGVTGRTVFDGQKLAKRLLELTAPEARGVFRYTEAADRVHISDPIWEDDPNGVIRIYRKPVEGRPYVIGGDTAGDGSDWFVGQVLDNITGEQVAVLHCQWDEDTYAKQMYCLGKYYNDAMLGIEANFSTYPIKLLGLMGYQKQFMREVEDNINGDVRDAFGFKTTSITRPVIIAELVKLAREQPELLNDEDTISEMLTFVREPKTLRPEAEPGAHDDMVMALAIAYYIRPQQSMTVTVKQPEYTEIEWTEDMWEDYRHADRAGREYLMQKWGKPRR